jgi:hypothetical protein
MCRFSFALSLSPAAFAQLLSETEVVEKLWLTVSCVQNSVIVF